jgi:hypothetical protein
MYSRTADEHSIAKEYHVQIYALTYCCSRSSLAICTVTSPQNAPVVARNHHFPDLLVEGVPLPETGQSSPHQRFLGGVVSRVFQGALESRPATSEVNSGHDKY